MAIGTKKENDRKKFVKMRKNVRKAIKEAKNEWFLKKAAEAQRGHHGGKVVWSCIRDMQRGRRGLVPVKMASVKNEEGNPCFGRAAGEVEEALSQDSEHPELV